MDLSLTGEQSQHVASFVDVDRDLSTSEVVAAVEPQGFLPALWATVVPTDARELGVPEERAGYGAHLLDQGLVAERRGPRVHRPAPDRGRSLVVAGPDGHASGR